MSDELQSDFLGNVGHESIGVLPEGLKKLSWLAIPALRHDGKDFSVFQADETPEFVAFMQSLNPRYQSECIVEIDDPFTTSADSQSDVELLTGNNMDMSATP